MNVDFPDKMNASRNKSPNPFLSNLPPGELSVTNLFLNSSVGADKCSSGTSDFLGSKTEDGNSFASANAPGLSDNLLGNNSSGNNSSAPSVRDSFLLDDYFGVDAKQRGNNLEDPLANFTSDALLNNFIDTVFPLPIMNDFKLGSEGGSTRGSVYDIGENLENGSNKTEDLELRSHQRSLQFGYCKSDFDLDLLKFSEFGNTAEVMVQTTVDKFDSVILPMNSYEDLLPVNSKVKKEIPVELKHKVDVFEALGLRSPNSPVESIIFDPLTPVSCAEDDDLSLGVPCLLSDAVHCIDKDEKGELEKSSGLEKIENIYSPEVSVDERSDSSEKKIQPETLKIEAESSKTCETVIDNAAFDFFEARFQNTAVVSKSKDKFDPFGDGRRKNEVGETRGFGAIDKFDPFLMMTEPPVPQPSPATFPPSKQAEEDSDSTDNGSDFSIFIKPKTRDESEMPSRLQQAPLLTPPPKSPIRSPAFAEDSPKLNPFVARSFSDNTSFGDDETEVECKPQVPELKDLERKESRVSILGSPLFDEDDSLPLEEFPERYEGNGWDMVLRQPNKKKITGQRFWKKVFVRLIDHLLYLYNSADEKISFQKIALQPRYSISEISAQQYDQYGKIFTAKLLRTSYRERVGVRPGQISKVAHGQITSFGQLAKLGLPLEHAPQVSQLIKLGSQSYEDLRAFSRAVEDALFRLPVHRDRTLTYKTEEIQVTVQEETSVEVSKTGHVNKQLARVRVFFLGFISEMPEVEIRLNDIVQKGKEVVERYDIIPVATEEWIRLEELEFHSSVFKEEFKKSRNIKLHPPDACFFELIRFRIRPPKNCELPLQTKAVLTVARNRIELHMDVLVPGYSSYKHGQVPCEDISFRFLLPDCWIYLFRTEKHFRYRSLKSATRKPGKIKGFERLVGAPSSPEPCLIEVSTGQAKYEHHYRSIVWRIRRLPKEGQGAYTEHSFVCRLELTSYDQIPEELTKYIYIEFTMPASTVSHTTVRSISVTSQNPPEKHVRYVAKCEYRVEIEQVKNFAENEFVAVTSDNRDRPGSADSLPTLAASISPTS